MGLGGGDRNLSGTGTAAGAGGGEGGRWTSKVRVISSSAVTMLTRLLRLGWERSTKSGFLAATGGCFGCGAEAAFLLSSSFCLMDSKAAILKLYKRINHQIGTGTGNP